MRALVALLTLALTGCASTGSTADAPGPADASSPEALLDRAIAASGGEGALERATTLVWEADAAVHIPGRRIDLRGRWRVSPPDSAATETWEAARGPETARRLVVLGDTGWSVRNGDAEALDAASLAHERDQFYLYSLVRLVPLRAPGVTLTTIPPDPAGRPGVRVENAGRPAVDLYFGVSGRPERLHSLVVEPSEGKTIVQDLYLAGTIEADGVRWPRQIHIVWDGQPFFDEDLTAFDTAPVFGSVDGAPAGL